MGLAHSPKIVRDGLVYHIDAASPKCYSSGDLEVEYLIVAGGGGGGGVIGGGGGAGGFLTGRAIVSSSNTITVGSGGAGGVGWNNVGQAGSPGNNSSAFGVTALGGGGGGYYGGASTTGTLNGGSGGGQINSSPIGLGTAGQGNDGGAKGGNDNGGGGGGASSAGQDAVDSGYAGDGGAGKVSTITGSSVYYAGGGGGGSRIGNGPAGTGGIGGGGSGTTVTTVAENGAANTGGGGGGGGYSGGTTARVGGNGGSGIVVVRYPGPQKAFGGTVTEKNGYTIHVFNASSSFTVGTNVGDISNNQNTGDLYNGVGYNSADSGSFTFDGTNDYILFSNPVTVTSPYTVLLWCKPDTLGTGTSSAGRKTPIVGPGPVWNPGIWVTQDIIRSHADTQYRDNLIDWSDLGWKLIGQIFDGTNCYNIFDGVILSGGTPKSYSPANPTELLLGSESLSGNSQCWDGQIGPVYFYNRVLTQSEVTQNFNATRGRYGV